MLPSNNNNENNPNTFKPSTMEKITNALDGSGTIIEGSGEELLHANPEFVDQIMMTNQITLDSETDSDSGSDSAEDEPSMKIESASDLLKYTVKERSSRFLDECGTNFILVDIDSLIDEAIHEKDKSGIDWTEHGGQWLHVFFYCESKLREWRNIGMGFQILYLEGNDPIAKEGELNGKILLRHLLYYHLNKMVSNDPELKMRHRCFRMQTNIYEDFREFAELCNSVNINCIVISPHNRNLLILLLNKTSIPVLSNITVEGNTLFSMLYFTVKGGKRYNITFNVPTTKRKEFISMSCFTVSQMFEKSISGMLDCNLNHQLAKVVIMTKLLQEYLPLNYRYQKVDKAVKELNQFLDKFYGRLFELIRMNDPLLEDPIDLFDGRLAHFILLWMIDQNQVNIQLPTSIQTRYNEIVTNLKLEDYDGKSLIEDICLIDTDNTYQYEFQSDYDILPINNKFMNQMFDLPESILTTNSNKKVFKDEYHYHNTEKISSVKSYNYGNDKQQSLSKLVSSFERTKKTVAVFTNDEAPQNQAGRENELKNTLPKKITKWREEFNEKKSNPKQVFNLSSIIFEEIVKLKRKERKITQKEKPLFADNISNMFQLLVETLFGQIEVLRFDRKENVVQMNVWIRFIYSFLDEYSRHLTSVDFSIHFTKLATICFSIGLNSTGNEIILRKSLKLKQSTENDKYDIGTLYLEGCETSKFFMPHPQQFSLTRVLDSLRDDENLSQLSQKEVRQFKIHQRLREDMDFIPDEWQEELIKHVNSENVSVLCNVPTSQGKTFICFYLIEKVLRESDTDVICFVVPTKALVNQIYCEISSRFDRRNLVGMATASSRINEFTSQVLITTPAMLEIYLLSPENAAWKSRIKYLILDEIHSAFEGDQAPYYEHIIQFLDCPILGLSATLDNRHELATWMKHGRRQKVEVVHLEDYKRFNPLEYYSYDISTGTVHVHPMALININNIKHEIPLMNGMSMHECLELFDLLREDFSDWYEEIKQIKFKSADLLEPFKWADAITFRRTIHEFFIEKSRHDENHNNLGKIIQHLYNKSNISHLSQTETLHKKEIIDLVLRMKTQNMLPAISFVFNKFQINKYLEQLVEYMVENELSLWQNGKIPSSVAKTIQNIEEGNNYQVEEVHIEALKLGIAAHFAAIDENYQIEVERLFRLGDIPLVFSTSTLALGVNMPCKTVVICGFSPFYTNGLFKQACGRAGRRGFDNKGRVILCGFNIQLQRRYLLSPPVMVSGSQGFPTSFTLRLFSSLSQKKDTFDLEDGIKRLLERPLFSLDNTLVERAAKQMKHLFRFNTEYLLQTEYLNEKCEPLSLSGLVTHLFYLNEQAFTVPHLVKTKFFDKFKEVHSDVEQDLLLLKIITYLTYRIRVGSFAKKENTIQFSEDLEDYAYSDILKDMVTDVKNHNDVALSIYSNFASVYATDKQEEIQDMVLPLSRSGNFSKLKLILKSQESTTVQENQDEDDWESFEVEEDTKVEESGKEPLVREYVLDESEFETDLKESLLMKHLSSNCIRKNVSISSFAALSGNMDGHYRSVDHFLQTLNQNICLTKGTIPLQDIEYRKLNAFLINLYKHGEIKKIKQENGFSTVYAATRRVDEIIKDLKKIRSSLILERCFADSTYYHPYLDSSIKDLLEGSGIKWNFTYQDLFDQWKKGIFSANFDTGFTASRRYQKFLKKIGDVFRHPFLRCLDRVIFKLNRIINGEIVYVTKKKEKPDMPKIDDEPTLKQKPKTEAKQKKPEDA